MRMRNGFLAAFAVIALTAGAVAAADTLRCDGKLIQPGATRTDVLAKCGEPSSKETLSEPVRARRPNGTTYIVGTTTREIWIYDRGSRKFPAVLEFEGTRLKSIEFVK